MAPPIAPFVPVEAATFVVGVAATIIRPIHRKIRGHKFHFRQQELIYDCLNGVAIVPFGLIIGSVFTPWLMEQAQGEKVLLAVGGFIGLVTVLGDLLRKPEPPSVPPAGSSDKPVR